MLRIRVELLIAVTVLFSSCTSIEQARNVQLLGFTGDFHALPQADHEGRRSEEYRNPTVNWSAYTKILLQPVTIREGLYSKLRVQERHDLLLLAGSFQDKLYQNLSKDYEMVESPLAGTMLFQVVIAHPEEGSSTPALWSNVAQTLQAVATIYTLAGKPPFDGKFTVKFMICDAQRSELLAAGIDRPVGRPNRFGREVANSWGEVKTGLEFLADLYTYHLCVLRGGSSCVEPKT